MADPEAAHKATMKAVKDDLIAKEKERLTQLKLTNPSLFDTKLKFVVTKLLYSNIYEKNNPFCTLFEPQNIQTWESFLAMYQENPLSVYTDKFPLKNKEGETTAGSEGDPVTTTLTNSQAVLLLMLYMYATQWIKGVPPRHSFTVNLEALANHPTKWDKQDLYQYNQIHFWSDVDKRRTRKFQVQSIH